jgi:hypothetical protein
MHGHIQRVPVVESHLVVQRSLAEGADGESPTKAAHEELLEPGSV